MIIASLLSRQITVSCSIFSDVIVLGFYNATVIHVHHYWFIGDHNFLTDFHFPTVRLTAFKEGAYFMGMKIFNHLPTNIKIFSNKIELFKLALKKYLLRQ
jgi:hypothetical protein